MMVNFRCNVAMTNTPDLQQFCVLVFIKSFSFFPQIIITESAYRCLQGLEDLTTSTPATLM